MVTPAGTASESTVKVVDPTGIRHAVPPPVDRLSVG